MKYTLLLSLVALACDDAAGPPSSRGAPQNPPVDTSESSEADEVRQVADPATIAGWNHDLATAWCQASFTCGRNTVMGDPGRGYWPHTSMAGCIASYEHMLASPISRAPADTAFDPARATACLVAIVERCDDPIYLPECDDVVDGTVALGGICRSDSECAGDAYCTGGYEPCAGLCAARRPRGAECSRTATCSQAEGRTVCGTEEGFELCTAADVKVVGIGEVCTTNTTRLPDERICAEGAYCHWSRETGAVCAPRIAVGERCRTTGIEPCVAPALCKGTSPIDAVCVVPTYDSEGGAACGDGGTHTCDLFAGVSCVAGRCQAWGDGLAGAVCDPYFAMASCATGFYCDDGGHCASSDLGSPCTTHWHCTSEFCDAGTCAPSPACTK